MRLALAIFFFTSTLGVMQLSAQTLPTDNELFNLIYGKAYKGGDVFKRTYKPNEQHNSKYNEVEYRIKYKSNITTPTQKLLLVILEAPTNTLHGHTWGYIDYYFLTHADNGWKIVNTINAEEPIGDASEFAEIAIGKSKTALVRTFESTGNQHYEKTHEVYYITPKELTFLFEITIEYSNEAFNTSAQGQECMAKKYFTTYNVTSDDKDWFDVKAHEKIYGFTNGCKDTVLTSEVNYYFKHNGTEYKQQLVRSEQ